MGSVRVGGLTACPALNHIFQITPVVGVIICLCKTKAEQGCHKRHAAELVSGGTRNQNQVWED